MSIYEEVKSAGIDLFVSYHPKVIKLKKESKILHKELKSKGLSLMQCQELTAKQNGFNNWYNFIHLIKKHYQQDLDNLPFIITTTKNLPTKSDYQTKVDKNNPINYSKWLRSEEDNPILLGYDINFGHYKWQNNNSMRTHQMILGESIYKRYDVYLANQVMKENRNIIFLDGEGDHYTTHSLVRNAEENNRQSDIKIIDFKQYRYFPKYEYKIQNNFLGSSGSLTLTFLSLLNINEDFWRGRCTNFLSAVMMYLAYQRDIFSQKISLQSIKESLILDNFINMAIQKDIPSYIKSSILNHLDTLPNFDIKSSVQPESATVYHEFLTNHIKVAIDLLIDSHMFDDNEKSIQLHDLLDKSKSNVLIVNFCPDKKEINEIFNKLFLNSIKGTIANLLGSSVEVTDQRLESIKSKNSKNSYLFIRSCYAPKGVSMLGAQSRSIGLSISFSYKNLNTFQELSDEREVEVMLANTNTKIFSSLESEPKTVALLEKYKNEVSGESVLNINDNTLSININYNKRKNDHVWLIKKGNASQISFDFTDDEFSNISSKNISIRMKLEDPEETYNLFEDVIEKKEK